MSNIYSEIYSAFPVRNRKKEKEQFRLYALSKAKEFGFEAQIVYNGGHNNVVIGNPKEAAVVFTAHYDTPMKSLFPNLMITNSKFLFILYQTLVILPLIVAGFAGIFFVNHFVPIDLETIQGRIALPLAFALPYFSLLFLTMRAVPNKNNANDNTTGIGTVFQIMKTMPEEYRHKAAFILFDNEERGCKGSKALSKSDRELWKDKPVVNFDCVGNGNCFAFVSKKAFTEDSRYETFRKVYGTLDNSFFFNEKKATSHSDWVNFPKGNASLACNRTKHGVLYCGRIHTAKDTVADFSNIEKLATASVLLAKSL